MKNFLLSDLKYMTLPTIGGKAEFIISYFYFILPILFSYLLITFTGSNSRILPKVLIKLSKFITSKSFL